jgi:Arc-like DNA binding domain
MPPKRKRGRPPQGEFAGKTEAFATRITRELRDGLEREAKRNGRSLSQEVELRLRGSLEMPSKLQRQWGPPHIRELARLVALAARSVEQRLGAGPFEEKLSAFAWHKNGSTHAAVCVAINAILARYKPAQPGPMPELLKQPSEWLVQQFGQERAERECTPEGVGLSCALGLLDQMEMLEPPPIKKPADHHYSENYYLLPQIREILK